MTWLDSGKFSSISNRFSFEGNTVKSKMSAGLSYRGKVNKLVVVGPCRNHAEKVFTGHNSSAWVPDLAECMIRR